MGYRNDLENAVAGQLPWEKLAGKNILVTGATGLIGGAVVELLMTKADIDYHVYASGRNQQRVNNLFSDYYKTGYFHFVKYDVTKELDSSIDFHFIIDAASGANPMEYATNPVGVMKSNIWGVYNLLDYGKKHNLQKFVYISSGEIYGEGDGRIFTEDYSGYVDCTSVRSCYPSSKRAAENLCIAFSDQYGLDVSIARLSHVYGPHFTESDTRVYAQFIRNVLRGEDIVMKSTGSQFRSWCYVVDCAYAIVTILLKSESGEAYNVADEKSNVSIKELAETIASIAGKKVVIETPPNEESKGFNVVTKSVFSTKKLEALGWKPLSSLYSGLISTIEEVSGHS